MCTQILILKFFSSQCSIGRNFVSYSVSKQRLNIKVLHVIPF